MKKELFPNYNDVLDNIHIQYLENTQRTKELHTHPFFQIFFLIKGKLTHHINNMSADMSIGEMAIIPPNIPHCISLENNPTFYSFSFTLASFGKISSYNENVIAFLNSLQDTKNDITPKTTVSEEDILYVKSLFERIYEENNQRKLGFEESIIAYSILLITQFIRRYNTSNPEMIHSGSFTSEQMVLNCIGYIENHFTEDLTLSTMAHMCALSESTFCSCFKKITGQTFHAYLNQCRINLAIELIRKKHKIIAVSSFCGYNDFVTFSRNFKKIVGTTPREYQKTKLGL